MHTLRGAIPIPWIERKAGILKGINLPLMMETTFKLTSNLHSSLVNYTNPSISSLIGFQLTPNDCHLRQFLELGDEHSLNNYSTAIRKVASRRLPSPLFRQE